jgi:hypothetical protein
MNYWKNEKSKWIYPSYYENVNYKLFTNKDGQYAWRLFQLIHPVLYVDLVHKITQEENWETIKTAFERFKKNLFPSDDTTGMLAQTIFLFFLNLSNAVLIVSQFSS